MAYRLVRSAELKELKDELAAVQGELLDALRTHVDVDAFDALKADFDAALERERALLRELVAATGREAASAARADFMTLRANLLDTELVQFKQRAGVPAVAAQVGKMSVGSELFQGAGADLFEDVGDREAERLAAIGVIATPDPIDVAPAASLAPSME
jgi:hypothetical protein